MDGDLYDEFGNYVGPELESDESEGEEEREGEGVSLGSEGPGGSWGSLASQKNWLDCETRVRVRGVVRSI